MKCDVLLGPELAHHSQVFPQPADPLRDGYALRGELIVAPAEETPREAAAGEVVQVAAVLATSTGLRKAKAAPPCPDVRAR